VAVIGLLAVRRLRATCSWGPGSVLVELSVVEQRYRAVLAVLAGESVVEVAAQIGISRQTLQRWLARYRDEGLGGLADRSHRPSSVRIRPRSRSRRRCASCAGSIPGGVPAGWHTSSGGQGWCRSRRRRPCIGSWSVTAWSTPRLGAAAGRTTSVGNATPRWRSGSSTSSGARRQKGRLGH
jgi:hypothetical protein